MKRIERQHPHDHDLWRRYLAANAERSPCPEPLALASWASNRLAEDEAAEVEEHLARCQDCWDHAMAVRELEEQSGPPAWRWPASGPDLASWAFGFRLVAATLVACLGGWGGYVAGYGTFVAHRGQDLALVCSLTFDFATPFSTRPGAAAGDAEEWQ